MRRSCSSALVAARLRASSLQQPARGELAPAPPEAAGARDPLDDLQVAQPPGRLLEVGLEAYGVSWSLACRCSCSSLFALKKAAGSTTRASALDSARNSAGCRRAAAPRAAWSAIVTSAAASTQPAPCARCGRARGRCPRTAPMSCSTRRARPRADSAPAAPARRCRIRDRARRARSRRSRPAPGRAAGPMARHRSRRVRSISARARAAATPRRLAPRR